MVEDREMLKRWSESAHRASSFVEHIEFGMILYHPSDLCQISKYLDICEKLIRQLDDLSHSLLIDSVAL